MKYNPRDSILTAHVGHQVTVRDARTLRCTDCSHTLLLDANKVVLQDPATTGVPSQADKPLVDQFGRRPCRRCGKPVNHVRVDQHAFDPVPHGHAKTGEPCR